MGLHSHTGGVERPSSRGNAAALKPAGTPKSAVERFAEKKNRTLTRKEKSYEYASEEDRPSHRRARPETAPEPGQQHATGRSIIPGHGSTPAGAGTRRGREGSPDLLRLSSAESDSDADDRSHPVAKGKGKAAPRQGSGEGKIYPAADRLYRGEKRVVIPRRNKPPYLGEPHTPILDLPDTLRLEDPNYGLPKNDWAVARNSSASSSEFDLLPLPGKTMAETLRQREVRTAPKMLPGGRRDGEGGGWRRESSVLLKSVDAPPEMSQEEMDIQKKRLAMLMLPPTEFASSRKKLQGKKKMEERVEAGRDSLVELAMSMNRGTPLTTGVSPMPPPQKGTTSPIMGLPGTYAEGTKKQVLDDKIKNSTRVDPVAFAKLSDRLVASRKENSLLKKAIHDQKETQSDLEEHVKRLQFELKHRLDSEQLGLRQIRDMQKKIDNERNQHLEEKAALEEQLSSVTASVKDGFKDKESEFQVEQGVLEELHRQLIGAGKVIAAMRRRIEEQQEMIDQVSESVRASEDRAEVLEDQKKLAEQQIKEHAAAAFDAQKKMRLSQDQLAKVLMRSEKDGEKQDMMYASVKSSVLQITKENESMRAKSYLLETDNAALRAELEGLKKDTEDKITQTEVSAFKGQKGKHFYSVHWNPWIWLTALSLIEDRCGPPLLNVSCQTDLNMNEIEEKNDLVPISLTTQIMIRGDAEYTDCSMQTDMAEQAKKSQVEMWWAGILVKAEHNLKTIVQNKRLQMSGNQIFSAISEIYSAKAVVDEVDDRDNYPRQSLAQYMYMHYLIQYGEVFAAEDEVVRIMTNILAHLRQIRFRPVVADTPKRAGVLAGLSNKEDVSGEVHMRVITFARFLGMSHHGQGPISAEGLGVYLGALMEVRKGQLPLLPTHSEKITVKQQDFLAVLDWVFAQSRAIVRQSIKTGLIDLNNDWDTVDLEVALDYTIKAWSQITNKWDARLESLFTTADTDSNGNLDFKEFQGMMEKLRVDEMELPSERMILLMYSEMALYPRVDSKTFVRVARMFDLCKFKIGDAGLTSKSAILLGDNEVFAGLETLIEKVQDQIEEAMNQPGADSKGVEQYWNILMQSMRERKRVSIAQAFFTTIVRKFQNVAREIAHAKDEEDKASKAAKVAAKKSGRRGSLRRGSLTIGTPERGSGTPVGAIKSAKDKRSVSPRGRVAPKKWEKLRAVSKVTGLLSRVASLASDKAKREGGGAAPNGAAEAASRPGKAAMGKAVPAKANGKYLGDEERPDSDCSDEEEGGSGGGDGDGDGDGDGGGEQGEDPFAD